MMGFMAFEFTVMLVHYCPALVLSRHCKLIAPNLE